MRNNAQAEGCISNNNQACASVSGAPEDQETPNLRLWTERNTRILIEMFKKYQDEFDRGVKKHIWNRIACEISRRVNMTCTAQQCDTKWKGLKNTYKQYKKHNETSGQSPKHWVHYEIMNDILHSRPEITPRAVCSNTNGLQENLLNSITEENQENEMAGTSETPSTSRSGSSFQSRFMLKRKRLDQPAERRHREKMQRQDRFLDLLERATSAMEKSVALKEQNHQREY